MPDWRTAWVNVRAERLDPDTLLAALKAGQYYSSQGPEIADVRIEGDRIRVKSSPARAVWVSETALTTALNSAYAGEQMALFGIVVGIALLLSGIGFGILAIGGALRAPDTALTFLRKWAHKPAQTPAVPA